MRPLPSPRSSSSTNRWSPSHINGSGAMAGDSTTHAATLQAHCPPTAAAMAEALAFHAASQEPQAQREHNGRDSSYRCKFCNRRFCTPQSLGGHHNSHRRLKITWQETRGRSVRRGGSVRRGEASHPLQAAAAPAVSPAPSEPSNHEGTVTLPPAPSEPSDQEGTVTIPPIRVVTVTLPGESALAILRRELQQPGGEGARHDPNHRGRNAVLPEDLMSEDAMKWVDGLLIDPEEEEAPAPALAGNNGGGGFADGSSVRMDPNLNL